MHRGVYLNRFWLLTISSLALAGTASAIDHPVSVLGRVYVDANCNGVIDSQDILVDGASVELIKADGTVLGVAQTGEFGLDGVYAFPSDMAPVSPNTGANYTLALLIPTGYMARNAVPGPFSTKKSNTAIGFNLPEATVGTSSGYDFLISQRSPFFTRSECSWGAPPRCGGESFLNDHFAEVYGTAGVTIGGNFKLTFTTARAVQNFLPQNGSSRVLTANATNPTSAYISELAGQLLALQLNVDFSDAGVTTAFLGNLELKTGALAGYSVRDLLTIGNQVLGGDTSALPTGISISTLTDAITRINGSCESWWNGCCQNWWNNCGGYNWWDNQSQQCWTNTCVRWRKR